jgi:hypothetical protein
LAGFFFSRTRLGSQQLWIIAQQSFAAHVRASAHNYRLQKRAGFPHDAGTSKPLPE